MTGLRLLLAAGAGALLLTPGCRIYDTETTTRADAGRTDDTGVPPGDPCGALPAWEGPRTCWKLVDCLVDVPYRECWGPVCIDEAPEASVELMDQLFTCLGERCSGLSQEEYLRCQGEQCYVELLSCAADSNPDTCWGLEACILRECGQDAPQECYDGCLAGASEACQDCRVEANTDFLRAHCAKEVLTRQRCADLHECMDRACAEEHCHREGKAIDDCFAAAVESHAEDYRERLDPCYPPPE